MITTSIGLIIGLVTGFYFERRQTRSAREQNKELEGELQELEEELAAVRTSVYSIGADPRNEAPSMSSGGLPDDVEAWARSTQNAEGRLSRTLLTSHFFGLGHKAEDIDEAIRELCSSGILSATGKWLEVK
jgi:hypothetical protein